MLALTRIAVFEHPVDFLTARPAAIQRPDPVERPQSEELVIPGSPEPHGNVRIHICRSKGAQPARRDGVSDLIPVATLAVNEKRGDITLF